MTAIRPSTVESRPSPISPGQAENRCSANGWCQDIEILSCTTGIGAKADRPLRVWSATRPNG